MRGVTLLASVAGLFFMSAASADVLHPGEKVVDPRVSFVGIDEYPDYVFYLRYQASRGAEDIPYRMIEVKDVSAFNLSVRNHLGHMFLLAIKRSEFNKRAMDDLSLNWLTEKSTEVIHAVLRKPSTRGSIYDVQAPVSAYRVTLQNGQINVDGPDVETFPHPSAWVNVLPMFVFGIFIALSLATLGIWFVRRRRLNAKTPTETPTPS